MASSAILQIATFSITYCCIFLEAETVYCAGGQCIVLGYFDSSWNPLHVHIQTPFRLLPLEVSGIVL